MKSKFNILMLNILQILSYFNENYINLLIHRSANDQNRSKLIDLPTIYSGALKMDTRR